MEGEECLLCEGTKEVVNRPARLIGATYPEDDPFKGDEHFELCPLCCAENRDTNLGENMKIKDWYCFTSPRTTIGIVVGEDEVSGERKGYIGTGSGFNMERDIQHIARDGAPVDPAILTEIANYLTGV